MAAGVATVGLALTGFTVFAGLNAVADNTSAQTVSSGTLKLTMTANGNGFTQSVTNMAPGDVVNRYVALTNGGTLDANGLTLGVADATSSKLTTDATNGLHVTVTSCTVAWSATAGTCGGTTTVLLSSTAMSSLISSPGTLVSGAIPAGTVENLQISTALPNQTETTTNGTLPGSTIQGLSASLTWNFTENQRTATTTNS
jgi:hypothetical protein